MRSILTLLRHTWRGQIASWKIHLLAILHDDIDLAIG
jgi:hypothetical protein